MPERYIEFDQLKPEQALDIVSQPREPAYLPYLRRIRVAIPAHSRFVSLFAPEQPAKRGQRQINETFLQILTQRCEQIAGHPRRNRSLPDDTQSLAEGAARLLYLTDDSQWVNELKIIPEERLFVGIDKPRAETAERFVDLRVHATQVQVGMGEFQGRAYTLFHVNDDSARRSTMSGLVAADLFNDWLMLDTLAWGERRLFVSSGLRPHPGALEAFCGLLQNSPGLFSDQSPRRDHQLLAAVIRQPDGEGVDLLFMRSLVFDNQIALSPSPAAYARFVVCDLANSEQHMKQLYSEIQEQRPRTGYRLELRATQFKDDIEVERERLQRELNELNYEMEYLNAYDLRRPILLRFAPSQLIAFGNFLSRLPGKALSDGALLYGFQATDIEPQGFHFLYVDPMRVKLPDLDPLINHTLLDKRRPMRFWLDPFWARHYAGSNRSKLFVPEYTTLFPSIHDWNVNAGEMDRYLQQMMEHWLQDHENRHFHHKPFPRSPIYIFDGPADAWADMEIYILDLDDFRPLHTKLGWLNDHLFLRQAWDVETTVTGAAADAAWIATAKQIHQRRNEATQTFDSAALQASQAVAEKTAVLMSTLTNKLEQIQTAADDQRNRIGELQAHLDRLNALYSQVARTVGQAQDTENAIQEQMQGFRSEEKTIWDEVSEFQQKAQEAITNVSQQINELVAELKQAYQREEEKLYNLNRRRR